MASVLDTAKSWIQCVHCHGHARFFFFFREAQRDLSASRPMRNLVEVAEFAIANDRPPASSRPVGSQRLATVKRHGIEQLSFFRQSPTLLNSGGGNNPPARGLTKRRHEASSDGSECVGSEIACPTMPPA